MVATMGDGEQPGLMLFDIDQTMVDVLPQQAAAFAAAWRAVYAVPGELGDVPFAGMTTPNILRQVARLHGVPDTMIDALLPTALATLVAHLIPALDHDLRGTRFPGVVEVLAALADTPHVLAVLTGNPPAIGELILRRAGLDQYFAFHTYGTEAITRTDLVRLSMRKATRVVPLLDPIHTVVVGDSCADVHAACEAGARAVLVRHAALPLSPPCPGADLVLNGFVPVAESVQRMRELLRAPPAI